MANEQQGRSSLWLTLHEIFGLDLRSMALFRVLVAIVLLVEIVARVQDARAFYTDEGMIPRAFVVSEMPFSLHMLDGSLTWQLFLFAVQAVFAVMLLVGYQTRLAVLMSWFLLISLIARNPAVHFNADTFLKMTLFWSMFLPLGAVWSIDSRFRPRPREVGPLFVNAGTIGYIGQICIVYVFAVLWKWAPEWRTEFTAVHYALYHESTAMPLAKFLRQFPTLTYLLTIATMIVEAVGPLLVLFPFATQWTRLLAVFTFIGLHAGFGACLSLAHFAPVCMIGWVMLLPPKFWDLMHLWCQRSKGRAALTLATRLPPAAAGGLESLRQWLLLPDLKLVTAVPNESGPTTSAGWWLAVEGEAEERVGGRALQSLLWWSPLWWPFAWIPASVLGSVATWLGRPVDEPLPAERYRERYLQPYRGPVLATLALFFLIYNVGYNARGLNPERVNPAFPQQLIFFGNALSLDQAWGVFAPHPAKGHGWYVVVATFADGSKRDLIQNREFAKDQEIDFFQQPPEIYRTYGTARWRRIYQGMVRPDLAKLQPYYADWVYREWNRQHPERPMEYLDIYFMYLETTPDGLAPPQKLYLYPYRPRSEDRKTS